MFEKKKTATSTAEKILSVNKTAQKAQTPLRPQDINQGQRQEWIRNKAYELFEARGRSNGNDWEDWFKAERIINSQKNR